MVCPRVRRLLLHRATIRPDPVRREGRLHTHVVPAAGRVRVYGPTHMFGIGGLQVNIAAAFPTGAGTLEMDLLRPARRTQDAVRALALVVLVEGHRLIEGF